ncbi:MAG: hypothetical protein HGB28_01805 [Oscillochloris sp.]|nr:hypothetical protein [Oscillochloris sp.]
MLTVSTPDQEALADGRSAYQITTLAMESTGISGIAIYNRRDARGLMESPLCKRHTAVLRTSATPQYGV